MKIGFTELILVAIVAFVVIGPDKLPEYARKLGKMLRELKKYTGAASEEIQKNVVEPLNEIQAPIKEAVAPLTDIKKDIDDSMKDVTKSFTNIGKTSKEEAKKAEEVEEVAELEDTVEELPEEPVKAEEPAAEPVKAEENKKYEENESFADHRCSNGSNSSSNISTGQCFCIWRDKCKQHIIYRYTEYFRLCHLER